MLFIWLLKILRFLFFLYFSINYLQLFYCFSLNYKKIDKIFNSIFHTDCLCCFYQITAKKATLRCKCSVRCISEYHTKGTNHHTSNHRSNYSQQQKIANKLNLFLLIACLLWTRRSRSSWWFGYRDGCIGNFVFQLWIGHHILCFHVKHEISNFIF